MASTVMAKLLVSWYTDVDAMVYNDTMPDTNLAALSKEEVVAIARVSVSPGLA